MNRVPGGAAGWRRYLAPFAETWLIMIPSQRFSLKTACLKKTKVLISF
jgi:hypothetical protein